MGYLITLDLSENVYRPIEKMASNLGQTPEELVMEWIVSASQTAGADPIESCIGAIESTIPDWVDNHDKYLGQS